MLELDKHILLKYFLLFGWFLLWGSLSFNPEKLNTIKNFEILNESIFNILDFLRGISTLIFSTILLFIIIFSYKKIILTVKKKFEYNFVLLLLVAFFLIQAIPYYYNNASLHNLYFLINSILSTVIIFILFQYYEKKDLNIIFYINFFFLCFICLYFGYEYLLNFFKLESNFYGLWGNINTNYNYIDIPRPTGLSRSFLLLFIIIYFSKTKSKNIFILKSIAEILCVFFILMLSSRTTYFLFFMFIITNFFWPKISKKKILKDILHYIILPIILIILVINLKTVNFYNINNADKEKKIFIDNLRNYESSKKTGKPTDFSSGRTKDWIEIIEKNENIFFGNGVMGDRILISQSASNGILYTYASSGLVGVFLLIILSLVILFDVLKYFFLKTYENKKLINISLFFIILILFRSILETSYTVFGIDFLILLSSFSILIKYKK